VTLGDFRTAGSECIISWYREFQASLFLSLFLNLKKLSLRLMPEVWGFLT